MQMPSTRIISIGEILWDVFPEGEFIGGAPFNLAAHAARLGNESYLLSAVGDDLYGRRALEEMKRLGVKLDVTSVSKRHATGMVTVSRETPEEASYTIIRPAAYDDVTANPLLLERMTQIAPQWLYFGTLFAHSADGLDTVKKVLGNCPGRRFYDVNLRDGHYHWDTVETLLHLANVVKLNQHELGWVGRKSGYGGMSLGESCAELTQEYAIETICITRGADGCAVYHRGELTEIPGEPVQAVSSVGAGDAFSAMLLHGIASGWETALSGRRANRLGAYVASRQGAIPDYDAAAFLSA